MEDRRREKEKKKRADSHAMRHEQPDYNSSVMSDDRLSERVALQSAPSKLQKTQRPIPIKAPSSSAPLHLHLPPICIGHRELRV